MTDAHATPPGVGRRIATVLRDAGLLLLVVAGTPVVIAIVGIVPALIAWGVSVIAW